MTTLTIDNTIDNLLNRYPTFSQATENRVTVVMFNRYTGKYIHTIKFTSYTDHARIEAKIEAGFWAVDNNYDAKDFRLEVY